MSTAEIQIRTPRLRIICFHPGLFTDTQHRVQAWWGRNPIKADHDHVHEHVHAYADEKYTIAHDSVGRSRPQRFSLDAEGVTQSSRGQSLSRSAGRAPPPVDIPPPTFAP